LCHRIYKNDLFCPYPKCKAEIKNVSVLLAHFDKKHELADMCGKDLMRHFIFGQYLSRIDLILNRRWNNSQETLGSGRMPVPWMILFPQQTSQRSDAEQGG
jgi:hypothetical protein